MGLGKLLTACDCGDYGPQSAFLHYSVLVEYFIDCVNESVFVQFVPIVINCHSSIAFYKAICGGNRVHFVANLLQLVLRDACGDGEGDDASC